MKERGGSLEYEDSETRKSELVSAVNGAVRFYSYFLRSEYGVDAREYLKSRGISDESIEKFSIGYAPESWIGLLDYLTRDCGFDTSLLMSAGLIREGNLNTVIDVFRNRIIFPISRGDGKGFVGLAGRTLDPNDKIKYLNTYENSIYKKSELLFGLQYAREPSRKSNQIIVMEGYMDAVLAHQEGFSNVVATGGTALTNYHANLLTRILKGDGEVVLCFDSDKGGISAVERAGPRLINEPEMFNLGGKITGERRVNVVLLPEGSDPADLLSKGESGREEFRKYLDSRKPFSTFYFNQLLKKHGNESVESRSALVRDFSDNLYDKLPIGVVPMFIDEMSKSTGIPLEHIVSIVSDTSLRRLNPDKDYWERRILGTLLSLNGCEIGPEREALISLSSNERRAIYSEVRRGIEHHPGELFQESTEDTIFNKVISASRDSSESIDVKKLREEIKFVLKYHSEKAGYGLLDYELLRLASASHGIIRNGKLDNELYEAWALSRDIAGREALIKRVSNLGRYLRGEL